jgi:hypothetical protein
MEDITYDPCYSSLGPLQPKLPCHVAVKTSADDAISDISERTCDNTGSEFSKSTTNASISSLLH